MKIISVVGARPNFIKIAAVHQAFLPYSKMVRHLICHTGQHFDQRMSKVFFDELRLPVPDYYLGIGGGSHAEQTARIMMAFEQVLIDEKPDLVIVPGDVNSTLACSLVAAKMGIRIAHVEAGLRSFDRSMPEETNRILTDHISDFLFVSEPAGLANLSREGISSEKVYFTGNVMIDSLVRYLPQAEASAIRSELGLLVQPYILVTFHRPSNVDDPAYLQTLMAMLAELGRKRPVVFPVHPRTMQHLSKLHLDIPGSNVILCDPMPYIDFLSLVKGASLIITDSGGIQEEACYLGVQCITVRDNTERPVTAEIGTNTLAGRDLRRVLDIALQRLSGNVKTGNIPDLWDGHAADRIAALIMRELR